MRWSVGAWLHQINLRHQTETEIFQRYFQRAVTGNQAEEPDDTSCMFGVIFGNHLHGCIQLCQAASAWFNLAQQPSTGGIQANRAAEPQSSASLQQVTLHESVHHINVCLYVYVCVPAVTCEGFVLQHVPSVAGNGVCPSVLASASLPVLSRTSAKVSRGTSL